MQYKGLVTIGPGKMGTYEHSMVIERDNLPPSVGRFCLTPPRPIDRLRLADAESDMRLATLASLRDVARSRSASPTAGPSNPQGRMRAQRRDASPRREATPEPDWEDWNADRPVRPLDAARRPSWSRRAGGARRVALSLSGSHQESSEESTVCGDGSPPRIELLSEDDALPAFHAQAARDANADGSRSRVSPTHSADQALVGGVAAAEMRVGEVDDLRNRVEELEGIVVRQTARIVSQAGEIDVLSRRIAALEAALR